MLRFLKPNLGMTLFGARVLFAFFVSSLVLAHEAHHEPGPPAVATTAEEQSFLKENDAAMARMMNDMTVKPSGDVDRDFVAMMSPHHQGAIDMAVIELRYGKNEQLRRIAQEIIVDQMQEIAAMKLAIGEQVSTTAPAPTQATPSPAPAPDVHSTGMHMDMPAEMKK
jgi:hypothetical protein